MLLMPSQGFGSRSLLVYFAIDSRKFRKIDRNRGLKKKRCAIGGQQPFFQRTLTEIAATSYDPPLRTDWST